MIQCTICGKERRENRVLLGYGNNPNSTNYNQPVYDYHYCYGHPELETVNRKQRRSK